MRSVVKFAVLALFAISFVASIMRDPLNAEVKGQFDLFSSVLAVPNVERRYSCGRPIMEVTDAYCFE